VLASGVFSEGIVDCLEEVCKKRGKDPEAYNKDKGTVWPGIAYPVGCIIF